MTDSDLEVCRVTADACGKAWFYSGPWHPEMPRDGVMIRTERGSERWNPLENPAQMTECVDKLLSLGWNFVIFSDDRRGHEAWRSSSDDPDDDFSIACPWREFPARELADIWRKK